MLHFLAISGSLRLASSNTVWLKVAAQMAPDNIHITVYEGLGDLPHFNPDLDNDTPPPAVVDFRQRLRAADAVLISSPEYAHGVPGVLKNALDWIVSSGEFTDKPTALICASRATYTRSSLLETLTVMMAKFSDETSPILKTTTNKWDIETVLATPELAEALKGCLIALASVADATRNSFG